MVAMPHRLSCRSLGCRHLLIEMLLRLWQGKISTSKELMQPSSRSDKQPPFKLNNNKRLTWFQKASTQRSPWEAKSTCKREWWWRSLVAPIMIHGTKAQHKEGAALVNLVGLTIRIGYRTSWSIKDIQISQLVLLVCCHMQLQGCVKGPSVQSVYH